jgi:hypothetical protein
MNYPPKVDYFVWNYAEPENYILADMDALIANLTPPHVDFDHARSTITALINDQMNSVEESMYEV